MKCRKLFILPILFILLSGCTSVMGWFAEQTNNAQNTVSQNLKATDMQSLMDALSAEGASVESGDNISQPFFAVEGQTIQIDGMDVQVFEFPDSGAAQAAASTISSDGSSIGTSMMMWVEAPHFYQSGRLIVIYVGTDEHMLTLLASILGEQIAGR